MPASEASGSEHASLLARHAQDFEERFGPGAPARRFFSPGRVNLMGAHLDYNGGPVMPMALDRGTFIALRPRTDDRLSLASTLESETLRTALSQLPPRASGRWYDYPLGVIAHLRRTRSVSLGADVLFGGNLPIGAGLSSSASICVGTAYAFLSSWGERPDVRTCIDAALWGEREFVGVHCGIMDPHAVALGRPASVLWLDCRSGLHEHLPFDAGLRVAIVDSGIRRELAKGDFNVRVQQCSAAFEHLRGRAPAGARVLCDVPASVLAGARLEPVLERRARHVIEELERTRRARAALERGELAEFGSCISAAHASLRDLFEVSVPELDCIVETALTWPGVLGARLVGAGFGGCALVLYESTAREGLGAHVQDAFERRFGRRPDVFFFRGDSGPREL